ncbi:MAG: Holliday junction resolvase RuvX [Rhodoferax sp.]|nr:Holliday junction resolvase RuvX [Rhodoferax sp.]
MPEGAVGLATLAVPGELQTFMALDFGIRRTGLAFGSRLLGCATALPTMQVQGEARLQLLKSRLAEWQPQALVVGIPFHPDGVAHENTLRARKFARSLRGRFGLPVFEVDERYSTTAALADGARDADAGAACIILEQFLRGLE